MNVEPKLTREKIVRFLEQLGSSARTPGRCYITGGGSALLLGWRDTTIDIDLKCDPEPACVFESIPTLSFIEGWKDV
jgi:hypothetical protein